jgi:hypothetical protein
VEEEEELEEEHIKKKKNKTNSVKTDKIITYINLRECVHCTTT